jgi:hypothetical protein
MGWVGRSYIFLFNRLLTLFKVERTNTAVAKSIIGRRFRLEFSGHKHARKGSRFLTEIRAGFSTFFAMAYIISVNASMVKGASCQIQTGTNADIQKIQAEHADVSRRQDGNWTLTA